MAPYAETVPIIKARLSRTSFTVEKNPFGFMSWVDSKISCFLKGGRSVLESHNCQRISRGHLLWKRVSRKGHRCMVFGKLPVGAV